MLNFFSDTPLSPTPGGGFWDAETRQGSHQMKLHDFGQQTQINFWGNCCLVYRSWEAIIFIFGACFIGQVNSFVRIMTCFVWTRSSIAFPVPLVVLLLYGLSALLVLCPISLISVCSLYRPPQNITAVCIELVSQHADFEWKRKLYLVIFRVVWLLHKPGYMHIKVK